MYILGHALAVVMGIILGCLGGGGSILTVPILVYIFNIQASSATGISLFVVGLSSFVAAWSYKRRGLINFRVGLFFALPSMLSIFLVRHFVLPLLPAVIIQTRSWSLSKDALILSVFSLFMLFAAFSMLRKPHDESKEHRPLHLGLLALLGLVIGALSGFIGAGGGFMIIPALAIFAKLPIKSAIGTSLFILVINSLVGFIASISNLSQSNWHILITFTSTAILGIFIGTELSNRIDAQRLRKAFAYFVLTIAIVILLKEL
jgi:uncharacterized membrane protein YfcA